MTGVKGESTAYMLTYQCPACGEISKLGRVRGKSPVHAARRYVRPAGLLQILKSSKATWLSGTPSRVSNSRVALSMAGGPHR